LESTPFSTILPGGLRRFAASMLMLALTPVLLKLLRPYLNAPLSIPMQPITVAVAVAGQRCIGILLPPMVSFGLTSFVVFFIRALFEELHRADCDADAHAQTWQSNCA